MGEAIGLIIAAIIAGVVSFLSLIISKEQSISDFRQQWIDALRKDIAIIVGRVVAIHGESIVEHKENQEELWTRLMCSAISSARTSSLVCTFFSKNSIRFCFSSTWWWGRS